MVHWCTLHLLVQKFRLSLSTLLLGSTVIVVTHWITRLGRTINSVSKPLPLTSTPEFLQAREQFFGVNDEPYIYMLFCTSQIGFDPNQVTHWPFTTMLSSTNLRGNWRKYLNMEFTQLIDLASTQYKQVVRLIRWGLIRLWVSYMYTVGAACVEVW